MNYCRGICNRFKKSSKRHWWVNGMRCGVCQFKFLKRTPNLRCPCCGNICKIRPYRNKETRELFEKNFVRY